MPVKRSMLRASRTSSSVTSVNASPLACARPVLASAVGGIPDALEDGASGFLMPLEKLGALEESVLLATNTSFLDVDAIAAATGRPGSVLGMHFFSPANVMRMLEVVRGRRTADEVLATGMAVARAIGRKPSDATSAVITTGRSRVIAPL